MHYREIVAVTGLGGLFQLLTTKSDGAIVKSVADKTTRFISARQHNVTPLESIEVYTIGDNVRLYDVFLKMQENQATITPVDPKTASTEEVKSYFKSIFPEFDEDRVYISDMKKMLKWYEILNANELIVPEEIVPEEGAADAADQEAGETAAEPVVAEVTEEEAKPKKAAKKKKAEAETESADATEAPAKKKAAKKKTEE